MKVLKFFKKGFSSFKERIGATLKGFWKTENYDQILFDIEKLLIEADVHYTITCEIIENIRKEIKKYPQEERESFVKNYIQDYLLSRLPESSGS